MKGRHFVAFIILSTTLVYIASFLRLHSKVQITLIGYEIGRLKEREAELIKQKSLLTLELAKRSTKQALLKRMTTNSIEERMD